MLSVVLDAVDDVYAVGILVNVKTGTLIPIPVTHDECVIPADDMVPLVIKGYAPSGVVAAVQERNFALRS